ncbi:hypothetical protein H6P81_015292 [Aristolochia fimbriata]|uniref:Uncharacterized protein n=1 Tax=Aristolochia fimbriata TaxID=158543 RepID=A0AAV7E8X2_ARIFI|nr:hypothetical protein H6P81_015292 [Aristolochia fimbriata]
MHLYVSSVTGAQVGGNGEAAATKTGGDFELREFIGGTHGAASDCERDPGAISSCGMFGATDMSCPEQTEPQTDCSCSTPFVKRVVTGSIRWCAVHRATT